MSIEDELYGPLTPREDITGGSREIVTNEVVQVENFSCFFPSADSHDVTNRSILGRLKEHEKYLGIFAQQMGWKSPTVSSVESSMESPMISPIFYHNKVTRTNERGLVESKIVEAGAAIMGKDEFSLGLYMLVFLQSLPRSPQTPLVAIVKVGASSSERELEVWRYYPKNGRFGEAPERKIAGLSNREIYRGYTDLLGKQKPKIDSEKDPFLTVARAVYPNLIKAVV